MADTKVLAKSLTWFFFVVLLMIGIGSGLCKVKPNSKGDSPLFSMLASDNKLEADGIGNIFKLIIAGWNVLVGKWIYKFTKGQGAFCAFVAGLGGLLSIILSIGWLPLSMFTIIGKDVGVFFGSLSGFLALIAWIPMWAVFLIIWIISLLIKSLGPIFFFALLIGITSVITFNDEAAAEYYTFPPALAFGGIIVSLILMRVKKGGPSQTLISKVLKAN